MRFSYLSCMLKSLLYMGEIFRINPENSGFEVDFP